MTTKSPCDDTTTLDCRGDPQIAVSGSSVHVIWQDNDGTDDEIYYRSTTTDGASFVPATTSAPTVLSSASDGAAEGRIVASGAFVHVVWSSFDLVTLEIDILYKRSTDSGASFAAEVPLSSTIDDAVNPDIAVSGSNDVYVVWQQGPFSSPETDIFFIASTNDGASFGAATNLFADLDTSENPQVAVTGNNVFVAWADNDGANFDIRYRSSTNNGGTFVPAIGVAPTNLSANGGDSRVPQIATNSTTGTNAKVYVAWRDTVNGGDTDILFKRSTDTGASFGSVIDLSDNSVASTVPRLSASMDNVYVAWQDVQLGGDTDIFFKSSGDGGGTFSGFQDLSNNAVASSFQQVTSVGTNAYVVWQDGATSASTEILFRTGASSSTDVAFDKSQYKVSDTAIITVVTTAALGTQAVTVTSSADPIGFSRTLTEIGTTGTYTGTITFTTGSSVPASNILKVAAGGTITATFGAQVGTASIFSATVDLGPASYTLSSGAVGTAPVIVTITDQNANVNIAAVESIVATITSGSNPTGITLTLTETGVNSGTFKNTNLIFMTGDDTIPIGSTATISQTETIGGTTSDNAITTIPVTVKSTTFPGGFSLTLTETGPNTGDFTNTLTFSSTGPSGGNIIQVAEGDIVSVTYIGESENAIVIPNPNAGIGAIQTAVGQTITASYQGVTDTATINLGLGGGGGAGGLVRPGLVLNVLASLAGGGGADASPPKLASSSFQQKDSFGNPIAQDPFKPILPSTSTTTTYPLTINGKGYGISSYANTILTNEVQSTQTINMDLVFFESSSLEHVALNFAQGDEFSDVAPTITFDKDQLQIHDPKGLFGNDPKATITKDGTKYVVHYDIKLIKLGEYNLVVRVWDDKRNTAETKIFDAFKVVEATQEIPPTEDTQNEVGIDENLISENIAPPIQREDVDRLMPFIEKWGGYSSESVSDATLLESVGIEGEYIPAWFKGMSGWVVKGDISPQEFVDAIRYLSEKGIIK